MTVHAVGSSRIPPARLAPIDVDQYHRMLETGILQDGQPIELLDGFLVYKDRSARGEDPMTIGTRHNTAIKLLSRLDGRLAPLGCHIQTQGPITIPPSHEPEPDGAVVRGEPREYLERHAGPGDVSSVFEVAESSLELDRTRKLEIYARAGIAQYVIVNLVDDRLDVFERPNSAQGAYEWHAERTAGDALSLLVPGGTRLDIPVLLLLP